MRGQLTDLAVNQVTRDGHHVCAQRVDGGYDALQKGVFDGRSHMHVTDLRQRKTVQRRRQPGNRHVYPHHRWRAPGIQKAQH